MGWVVIFQAMSSLDYFSDVQVFFNTQKLPMGIRVVTLGSKQVEKTSQWAGWVLVVPNPSL